MRLVYSDHLQKRLRERKFPQDFPRKVFYKPDQKFADIQSGRSISIKKLPYSGKIRHIMISFEYNKPNKIIRIITIHPETEKEIAKRLNKRRYILR